MGFWLVAYNPISLPPFRHRQTKHQHFHPPLRCRWNALLLSWSCIPEQLAHCGQGVAGGQQKKASRPLRLWGTQISIYKNQKKSSVCQAQVSYHKRGGIYCVICLTLYSPPLFLLMLHIAPATFIPPNPFSALNFHITTFLFPLSLVVMKSPLLS